MIKFLRRDATLGLNFYTSDHGHGFEVASDHEWFGAFQTEVEVEAFVQGYRLGLERGLKACR